MGNNLAIDDLTETECKWVLKGLLQRSHAEMDTSEEPQCMWFLSRLGRELERITNMRTGTKH